MLTGTGWWSMTARPIQQPALLLLLLLLLLAVARKQRCELCMQSAAFCETTRLFVARLGSELCVSCVFPEQRLEHVPASPVFIRHQAQTWATVLQRFSSRTASGTAARASLRCQPAARPLPMHSVPRPAAPDQPAPLAHWRRVDHPSPSGPPSRPAAQQAAPLSEGRAR